MELVENDGLDTAQDRVGKELAQQHALGDITDPGGGGGNVLEPDLVPDLVADLAAALVGDPAGQQPGRQPARL